ncbi:MAG TPA: TatD family hydrolase [Geminicoccaceae bacterium]|nr:TatD family hydrolase [Geminicoccaceae bacterium]
MLVDSHCHLDFPDFAGELDAVVGRARAAGVRVMQTIGTRLSGVGGQLALARRYEGVFVSVGVHPHQAGTDGVGDEAEILALIDDPRVIGIGESGLDYYYEYSTPAEQERSFRTHIRAARASGLPLIVHTRDADEATAATLRDEMAKGPFTGVVHCYSSSRALGEAALEMGFYLGIGGILTFKRSDELRAIVGGMPLERLLLETDAPYLAPQPRRGKRNEPAFVAHVAATLAEVKGLPVAEVERITSENFFRLFRRATRPPAT